MRFFGVVVAGRLYNRLGPRPLIALGIALTVGGSLALQRSAALRLAHPR